MRYDVTIGIPVYRAVDYIGKTLESALNQTFPNIEYLILDDCGEDGSMLVVERITKSHPRKKDVRILYNERNCGVGMSRNRILDEAKGDYLFFLDSDDIIEPDTIEIMVRTARQFDAQVVYGSWERVDNVDNTPSQQHVYPMTQLLEMDSLALYAFKNHSTFWISVCNSLINLDFLRKTRIRFLDTVFWEDLAFTYEMVTYVSRAILLPQVTYHYLCRPGSLSHYVDREKLEKREILRNVATIDYLKEKYALLSGKKYLPFLSKNLEVCSFYIACYVIKHASRIVPAISNVEIQSYLRHPLSLCMILKSSDMKWENFCFFLLSILPNKLFISLMKFIGKKKGVI